MSQINLDAFTFASTDRTSLLTGKVRLSFPNLVKPRSFDGGPAKFSAALLIPKTHNLDALKEAIKAAAEEKWGDRIPPNLRLPLRDGAEKADKGGYGPDVYFVNCSSNDAPQLVDRGNTPVGEQQAEKLFYPGCYVIAYVRAFAYDARGNKGVGLGLNAIQFLNDGERLGSRMDATKVFGNMDGAADADPFNQGQQGGDQTGGADPFQGGGQQAGNGGAMNGLFG